jgi:hypothetical protein
MENQKEVVDAYNAIPMTPEERAKVSEQTARRVFKI